MRRKKEVRYVKPSLVLKGKHGKGVLRTIRNTPPQDLSRLIQDAENCERKLMEMKNNGTAI